ncbi:hypothetical protein [Deinococcus xinjiangensis]|uniref:hypothetical protein n=1 Tax=Deinococcus xinjiangensis TaxID=457454 RepID=UPI0033658DF8
MHIFNTPAFSRSHRNENTNLGNSPVLDNVKPKLSGTELPDLKASRQIGLFDDLVSPEVSELSAHTRKDSQDQLASSQGETRKDSQDQLASSQDSGTQNTAASRLEPVVQSILEFCLQPKSATELASELNLDATYLRQRYTSKLVKAGHLSYTTSPTSPNVKYVTTPLGQNLLLGARQEP